MLTVQPFTFNPVQERTYIVYNEKRDCCIIDPGCYFASEEGELAGFIEQNGLNPRYLLNTHCHLDHVFGNRFIQRKYGLTLHLHRLELPLLQSAPSMGEMWELPFENYEGGQFIFLDEGDTIDMGEGNILEVLFTPGHSPGSISFYSHDSKWIISGDVLFQGSIGRTDLPGGDLAVLEQSIKTKLFALPGDVVVYPGHMGSTTIADEMKTNPFVKMI